jgi:hypothetical protein
VNAGPPENRSSAGYAQRVPNYVLPDGRPLAVEDNLAAGALRLDQGEIHAITAAVCQP